MASSAQYVISGEATKDYLAVVALTDETKVPFCTGTLVSKSEVLTAAHCFLHGPKIQSIYFGSVPGDSLGTLVDVASVEIDERYDPENRTHDLAVATLASNLDVPPLPLALGQAVDNLVGAQVRVVGFGRNTLLGDDLEKRTGLARVVGTSGDFIELAPDPAAPCGGDSGGPVLFEEARGAQIVGVISHGDPLCAASIKAVAVNRRSVPFHYPPPPTSCALAMPRRNVAAVCLGLLVLAAACSRRTSSPKRAAR